jgi:hypothetical protein
MAKGDDRPTKGRLGRRGFMKGVGASALGTAAMVFGTPRAAQAYTVQCCHLAVPPSGWNDCASRSDRYIWKCNKAQPHGTCYRFECCDGGKTPWGTWTVSAWRQVGIC